MLHIRGWLSIKDVRDFREGRGEPKVDYYGLEGGRGPSYLDVRSLLNNC
jgi:hypothetical protein